jgi:hypothetical protein
LKRGGRSEEHDKEEQELALDGGGAGARVFGAEEEQAALEWGMREIKTAAGRSTGRYCRSKGVRAR